MGNKYTITEWSILIPSRNHNYHHHKHHPPTPATPPTPDTHPIPSTHTPIHTTCIKFIISHVNMLLDTLSYSKKNTKLLKKIKHNLETDKINPAS